MQMSILLLDKPVLNPLVAPGLTSERAFKTIQLGVILAALVQVWQFSPLQDSQVSRTMSRFVDSIVRCDFEYLISYHS